jgi:MFS family permease
MQHTSFTKWQIQIRRSFRQFTWGGDWAIPLSSQIKHNLYWFFFDGLFSSGSDNIVVTYLVLYILALGATSTQVGLMSSFSSLSAALLLLPGALMVERLGHRKEITILFAGGVARLALLLLAFLPLFVGGQALVWVAIALSVVRDSFASLAFPAWMSVIGDIVPMEGRGRYFGSRNFIMGIAGILMILLIGELITRTAKPLGYQVALGLAFALGMVSTFSFGHLRVSKSAQPIPAGAVFSIRAIFQDMQHHPVFIALCLVMTLWNFSLNIAGPFFNVYMVQNLKFTASMVGIASIVSTIASLLIQRWVGRISDRWGPRNLQLVSMVLIPILPLAWIFITKLWHVVLLNTFGGVMWGAFSLVSFNFLLSLTPDAQRARYSAIYQVLITLSLAGGAALGAWVVTVWGYKTVFLWSAIGRMASGFLFLLFVSTDGGGSRSLSSQQPASKV